jgi:hypothetical protein
MNMKLSFGVTAAALVASALALSSIESGLKAGESVSPFHPTFVAGPLVGEDACFPCTYKNRPQVQVWVNGESEETLVSIAKSLQQNVESHKGKEFQAMIVYVGPSKDCMSCATKLKAVAEKSGAKDVSFAVIGKKDEAVSAYKINLDPSVKNTVIAYKNWKVVSTAVNVKGDEAGCAAICDMIAKITN